MNFVSTRGHAPAVRGTEAIMAGLAPDGGLYVPTKLPKYEANDYMDKNYFELAYMILHDFFPEISEENLKDIINNYRKKFPTESVCKVQSFDQVAFLELYHGPTSSFKDMALTLLPSLLTTSFKINNKEEGIFILVATSGDTGSAALEGFANVDGTQIAVLYPENGVSPIQKIQMENVNDKNVRVFAIDGNFDDAQRAVKEIMKNPEMRELASQHKKAFSSANSINIGRLSPQIVYYFYAYQGLVKEGRIEPGQKISISVPTGNFGDILAGIYAKEMGLPLGDIICASNENKVLTDFIETGVYDSNRDFILTSSPSMDILISSNLERYLYLISDGDSKKIDRIYADLEENGTFTWDLGFPSYLKAKSTDDEKTKEIIEEVFEKFDYLIDPHTAVAYNGASMTEDYCLVVSTASPYKFIDTVIEALKEDLGYEDLSKKEINDLSYAEKCQDVEDLTKSPIPSRIKDVLDLDLSSKNKIKSHEIETKIREVLEDEN